MNLKHDKPYAELRAMMRKYEISQAELGRLFASTVDKMVDIHERIQRTNNNPLT